MNKTDINKTGPIMAALLVAGFVGLFSETALNIALGELSEIFNVDATTIQWLATGYFLTLGILIPVTGILMQKFTTRQMFLTSIFLTLIGTILAASAPAFGVLLAGRIIQAAGLAINLPLTQNVIFTIFPPNKRGGSYGSYGLSYVSWSSIRSNISRTYFRYIIMALDFLVNSTFLTVFSYFRDQVIYRMLMKYVRFRLMHYLLFFRRLDSVVLFTDLVYLENSDGPVQLVLGSIIIGLVALIIFAIRQTKMETPMMNLKAFKYPTFRSWRHYEFHHVL